MQILTQWFGVDLSGDVPGCGPSRYSSQNLAYKALQVVDTTCKYYLDTCIETDV